MKLLITVLCCALLTGCATMSDADKARGATIADNAASQAVLSTVAGAHEVGLGWWALPLRLAAVEYATTQPPEKAQPVLDGVKASGWMGTTSAVMAALGAGPAGLIVALGVGAKVWTDGAAKREFLVGCAQHKAAIPDAAQLPCVFKE